MNVRSQKFGPLTVTLKFNATPDSDWSIGVFGEDRQYGWLRGVNDATDPLVDWLRELESAQVVPRLAAECRRTERQRKSMVVFVPSDDRLYRRDGLATDGTHPSTEPLCEMFRKRGYPCDFLPDAQGGLYTIRDRAHGQLDAPVLLSVRIFGTFRRPPKFRWEVRERNYGMGLKTDPAKLVERVIATIENSYPR